MKNWACNILDKLGLIKELSIPKEKFCGIYFLCKNNRIIYIGRSKHIVSRVCSHINMEVNFDQCFYIQIPENQLGTIESSLIKLIAPEKNNGFGSGQISESLAKSAIISFYEEIKNKNRIKGRLI